MKTRIAGINFDHFHMGDLLRMAHDHPDAEIVALCDPQPERMQEAIDNFAVPPDQVFTDTAACLEKSEPDLVILCPAAARHAEWFAKVAPHTRAVIMEKPFAASLAEADQMIADAQKHDTTLAINWPLRWVESHVTAHHLVTSGRIGTLTEIHYYDGNRGPLYHGADKIEKEPTPEEKDASWFYKAAEGGGSLLDYLGYGTTLATWFNGGQRPTEVTCMTGGTRGLEVDEHSVTVARYPNGALSKFETRWGTFTDPWVHQPQPRCGFVLKGTAGTIASYDYQPVVHVQDTEHPGGVEVPVTPLEPPFQNPVQYVIHCLATGSPIEGPLAPETARIGQQIVDTAFASARQKRTLDLIDR